jgi:hypothetical protein
MNERLHYTTPNGMLLYGSVSSRKKSPCRIKPDYKTGLFCFSTKHTVLRSKSKDWLAQEQDNVYEWSDMFTHVASVSQINSITIYQIQVQVKKSNNYAPHIRIWSNK